MFDDVVLRSLENISFGYWRIRSSLPFRIRPGIERLIGAAKPTRAHLKKIESLGLAIGLERNEIQAVTGQPIDNTRYGTGSRSAFLDTLVGRIVCLIILIVVLIVILFIAASPDVVYAQGTRYGSISPNDFTTD